MRKRLKQIFSAALAGIVMCTAITFYPVETKAAADATAKKVWEGVSSADWMSAIDGSTKLSAINIPGTHDSTTKNVDNSNYSKCQDKGIAEQLELGIRYLDIRLDGSVAGKLYCVHSSSTCYNDNGERLDLQEVLDDCYAFLTKHPTETIVMRMKEDNGSIGDKALQTAVHAYINKNPGYWYVTNGRPSLDETRGKIVLARYYCHGGVVDAGAAGLNFSGWPEQDSSSASNPPYVKVTIKDGHGIGAAEVWVQDWYKLSANDKWSAAQTSLDYAKTITNPDYVYFLNYLSSSGPSTPLIGTPTTTPSAVAKSVNPKFQNYNMEYGANYGWVVMDFATEDYAKQVYTSNKSSKLEAMLPTMEALSIPATVESDMLLPTTGEEIGGAAGTSITWSCEPANALSTIGGKFILVRQPSEKDVTLTATVSSGNCSKKKEFKVKVSKLPDKFAELGTVLGEAEAILSNPANAKYDLDSLEAAVETARALLLEDADNVSEKGIKAAKEILDTIMDRELVLKSAKKLRENLIAWYPLTSSSKDVSGNHNNGAAIGVTFDQENGARFTGQSARTSYISLPASMFKRTVDNNNLTFSFWVKDDRTNNKCNAFGFGNGTVCKPEDGGSKHFIVNTKDDNGNLVVNACPNGWAGNTNNITTTALPVGTWTHLAVVMEGKKMSLYRNGTEVKTVTADYSLAEMGNVAFAYIGNAIYAHNSDSDFRGNIKDFRVYDCAIAPELVEEIYNDKDMDVSSDSGHLVARYPLTADSKNVAGKGNDGVATGVTFSPKNGATFNDKGQKQSYISLPTAMFDGEEQMTFSFWAKDTKPDGKYENNTVFGIGSGTEPDGNNSAGVYKYVLINTNNRDYRHNLKAVITKNTWRDEKGFNGTECSFPANEWAHITCVFDGTKFALYKNGDLIGNKDTGIKLTDIGKNTVAYIGNSIWTHNDVDYSGSVKDFRIYDCALSEAEAKGLMKESIKDQMIEGLLEELDLDITKEEDGSLSMRITDAIDLPTTVSGGTITWNSDKTDVIANTGKVTLPAADQPIEDVTLTATVTINGKTTTITFHCEVFTKLDISTADLQAILSSVEMTTAGLNEADYTASSWKAFQDALAAAKQQIKKPTSKEAVELAAADLQTKKNAFVMLGDKTDLNTLINEVKSLKKEEYTTATWTEFEAALTAAEQAAKSNDVSQDDVETAQNNLSAKRDALKKRGDKTKLNAAIAEAQAYEEEDYTQETWAELQNTLDEVKETVEDIDATEEDVTAAEQSLDSAVKALKKITYTVTFKPDNGSDDITEMVERKDKVPAPQEPEKEGYIFDGWFEADAEEAFDVENTAIMSNVTLTAKWAVKRTVTFNPDNDTPTFTQFVKDGGKATKPDTPEKQGHGFVYWYVEGEDTAFDFKNTAITADIILKAKWTEGYTVIFNPDTGNDDDIWTEVVKDGEKVTKPEPPEKAGYEFEGWYAEGEESEFDFANTVITANTTLKAKWTKLYKVTFNPDNDTDDTWIEEVKAGEMVSEPEETPERTGYEFEGWYAEGEESEFDFANTSITADITLTAKWKETSGNVTTLKPTVTQQGTGSINVEVDAGSIELGEKTEVVIAIPDSIAENIKICEGTEVSINVNIPDGIKNNENVELTTITLPKEALEAASDEGKDLIITVNGDNSYQWVFKAEQLASAEITAENLLIQKDSAKEAEAKNKLNADEEGMVFSIAQEGAVPESVSLDTAGMNWKPNDVVNLSYYDFATQKLEPVSGTYTVDENGKVTIKNPNAGTTYVLWRKNSATVTGITLNETSITLTVGASKKLQASVQPESMAGTTVTWTSKNQGVATVAQDGTVTAVAVGETIITATAGDETATCKVTVKEDPKIIKVKTLTINAKKLTLGGGEKFTLKVTITPKNATNTQVTWTSSNTKAATINDKGVVTAQKVKKPAKTTITAKVDGKTIQCTVTVKPAPKKIALNAKSKTLKRGKTFQVKVKYTPKNAASYKLTYSVDKKGKKVVSVDSKGKIKAKKKGKATITVTTYNKKKATIKITVK